MSSNNNADAMFDEEFGDLLSDVEEKNEPVVEAKKPDPIVEPVAPKEEPVQKAEETGMGIADFGSLISSFPVPKFKASKDSKARFAILSKKIPNIKTHYVQGIGNFICLNDKCCELEGMPKVRYLIPVVQYSVNKAGQIVDKTLEMKVLSVGAEQYQAIVDAVQFSGRDATDVDIVATCSDEQYQKMTFAADASKGASWKSFGESAKEIVEKYKAYKDYTYPAVAKKISLETYLMKKGLVGTAGLGTEAPQFSSIDDILE